MTHLAARLAADTIALVRIREPGEHVIGAVNLGPGDPRYAHSDDEQVSATALARTYDIVSAFLAEEA